LGVLRLSELVSLPSASFGKLHLWPGGGLMNWRFLRKDARIARMMVIFDCHERPSFRKHCAALRRKMYRHPLESRSTICFPKAGDQDSLGAEHQHAQDQEA
jgi:hypothetical protein